MPDWSLLANIATVVVPTVGFAGWVLKGAMRNAVLENNAKLLEDMNGKYLRTREQLKDNAHFKEKLDEHQRCLQEHEDRLDEIEHKPACGSVLPQCEGRFVKLAIDQGLISDHFAAHRVSELKTRAAGA